MSESDSEKAARSVALEQAYVHEVYEQCAEKTTQSRHWPRIYEFLEELEPGALVCDIGCGNGKYLSINDNVFKVGVDRCKRLTDVAREKENEVLICDNLALPFRDESFDAVLSIAVVHHFATTERRVNALKELARVLRIGGRLVISVWAMEQRQRKFESQDVLVPWPKAYYLNSESNTIRLNDKSSGGMPCINELDNDRIAEKCLLTSKRNGGRKFKSRSYWIDPIFSPSPSTSSLSSPNETCYSFFRRALQKLAGGKRGSGNRAWFLENWQNGGCKNRRNYEIDEIGDVDDIPIELRRLEDDNVTFTKLPDALSLKSKSLDDILEIERLDLVRSRSSIPGFSSTVTSELYLDEESKTRSPSPTSPPPSPPPLKPSGSNVTSQSSLIMQTRVNDPRFEFTAASKAPMDAFTRSFSSNGKPKLVKQKTHIPDDGTLEFPEKLGSTAIREIVQDLKAESAKDKRRNVHKQSSMNEELMSMERLIERDQVRRNIMKQASLNEEIICKPSRTFGHFRDSILYSGNATKRFKLIKSGLTNRIKQSTTSMEKVSSLAIKNGFVKILQGWTSSENNDNDDSYFMNEERSNAESLEKNNRSRDKDLSPKVNKSGQNVANGGLNGNATANACTVGKFESEPIERRLSREDGSDSSKDSSLQSDTSVDSEDSFASVIYVPKQQQQRVDYHNNYQQQQHHNRFHQQNSIHNHHFPSLIDVATIPMSCYKLRTTSAPPSPRIKHPPDSHGPRIKLISVSPLLKQFPATSKSLPPPSPPGLSLRNLNPFSDSGPFFPPSDLTPFDSSSTIRHLKSPTKVENDCDSMEEIKSPEKGLEDINKYSKASGFVSTMLTSGEETGDVAGRDIVIISEELFDESETKRCNLLSDVPVTDKGQRIASASVEVVECDTLRTDSLESKEKVNPIAILSKITTDASMLNFDSAIGENIGDDKSEKSSSESINDDGSRRTRLNQIKELLRQKPGFATRCTKSSFPLVRRASTATSGYAETIDARSLPRLLSLELYNPETDDLDSDSSGQSSPESVGSVISVISDERFTIKKDVVKTGDTEGSVETAQAELTTRIKGAKSIEGTREEDSQAAVRSEESNRAVSCTQSLRLLEAAVSVANSLQETVDTAVIRFEPHRCHGRGYVHHSNNEAEPTSKNLGNTSRVSRVFNDSPEARISRISRNSQTRDRLDLSLDESNISDEECQRDAFDFTKKFGNNIINDIERYCQSTRLLEESETIVESMSDTDESIKTTIERNPKEFETSSIDNSAMKSIPAFAPDTLDLLPNVSRLRSNCKYSQLVEDTIAWLRGATSSENDDYCEYTDNNENLTANEVTDENSGDKNPEICLSKSLSEDILDFVVVSKNGECISMAVATEINNEVVEGDKNSSVTSNREVSLENANSLILKKFDEAIRMENVTNARIVDGETIGNLRSSSNNKTERGTSLLRYGHSLELTEIEDSIGNSVSLLSDASETESLGTPRFCNSGGSARSTVSLESSNPEYKTLRERRKYLYQKRSASEEIPSKNLASDSNRHDEKAAANRTDGFEAVRTLMGIRSDEERHADSIRTLNHSGSSSQESLLSDHGGKGGGGATTYHRYYHVFREGELDQLIDKYVENLHIISSYYDHASWCIVAEKVQVWTI